MKCIIAEKPSVARDIARIVGATHKEEGCFSGNGHVVTWAFGHLVTLAMPEAYGLPTVQPRATAHYPRSFPMFVCVNNKTLCLRKTFFTLKEYRINLSGRGNTSYFLFCE